MHGIFNCWYGVHSAAIIVASLFAGRIYGTQARSGVGGLRREQASFTRALPMNQPEAAMSQTLENSLRRSRTIETLPRSH